MVDEWEALIKTVVLLFWSSFWFSTLFKTFLPVYYNSFVDRFAADSLLLKLAETRGSEVNICNCKVKIHPSEKRHYFRSYFVLSWLLINIWHTVLRLLLFTVRYIGRWIVLAVFSLSFALSCMPFWNLLPFTYHKWSEVACVGNIQAATLYLVHDMSICSSCLVIEAFNVFVPILAAPRVHLFRKQDNWWYIRVGQSTLLSKLLLNWRNCS